MNKSYLSAFKAFLLILLSLPCRLDSSPQVWNLANDNPLFVGREDILQDIRSFFKTGYKNILALTGGPGFGKTQIAKRYAQRFYKHYDLVWQFDAGRNLPAQFEQLAAALNYLTSTWHKEFINFLW